MTDTDLDEFRKQWREEVEQQKQKKLRQRENIQHTDAKVREKRAEAHNSNNGLSPDIVDDDLTRFEKKHQSHVQPEHAQQAEVYINDSLNQAQLEALENFELAAEREHAGNLSDAIKHYRIAYRKDDKVDKLYREKYFAKNKPLHTVPKVEEKPEEELVSQFQQVTLEEDEILEQGPLMHLPTELLVDILRVLALSDLSAFTKMTFTCKKIAYAGYSSPVIWKALCMKEYTFQHYTEQAIEDLGGDRNELVIGQEMWNSQWRRMYLERPRVWFNGVYISTCNYVRPGFGQSWNAPIHMVTYYRYLRFFENGRCISLLTTGEPAEVVPVFNHQILGATRHNPVTYVKEDGTVLTQPKGIVHGSWTIQSGGGRLFVETEGSVDRYLFYMQFDITSSGKNRHNKLKWHRFWNMNKLTQNEADFVMKHDKPFYFVRTRR